MPVRMHKRADNGFLLPEINPIPRAHLGVIHSQFDGSAVYKVNCGLVEEVATGTKEYCEGYAQGANLFMTMNTHPVLVVTLETMCSEDGPAAYAEWFAGLRRDAFGNLRPNLEPEYR